MLKNQANEVKDTYEFTELVCNIFADTSVIKEIFEISDEFEREFVNAIATFKKTEIGPYITEKYFMLIPSLKEAMEHLMSDGLTTRKCVINFPKDHCFQSMQFLFRESTVRVVCYMRSCNAIKNLPHDIWICSLMADMFAKHLEDTTGIHPYSQHSITMMFGSLHVFKKELADVL